AVAGSVNAPAIYELRSGDSTTVGEVLELAAGMTSAASGQTIRLERVDEHRMRSTTQISLDGDEKATVLRDGDLLELIAVLGQYKDAVTLRGNVANPGRYGWKPGMRVRDLLPNKDALITRDYWLKHSQLGQPMLTYIPTCFPTTPYGIPDLRYGIPFGEEGENPNWRYSSTRNPNLVGLVFGGAESGSRPTDDRPTDGGLDCGRTPESETSLSGINDRYTPAQSAAVPSGTNPQNQANPSGFQPNAFQSNVTQQTMQNRNQSATSASVGIDVGRSSAGQFRPRNDVNLTEPDINWAYAVIERQSKENL